MKNKNNIAMFKTEKALKAFAAKNGMKFASACIDNDRDDEAGWVEAMKARCLAVVWLDNYTAGQGAYLAFHRH